MVTHSGILARESHGQRSLGGYSPWGCKESDSWTRLKRLSTFPHQLNLKISRSSRELLTHNSGQYLLSTTHSNILSWASLVAQQ